ncbi:acyl-CoA thioesterase [Roseivirga sp. BDSF3-8]|uniref:acyl-CoA thioesterase n=1 Tax=Roseivirga sp. BDSF3-8 TaxID=3241598 RepID=UPI0035325C28
MDFSLDAFCYSTVIQTRWSDFDMLGHANNAVYITWLETARMNYVLEVGGWDHREYGMVVAHVSIDYKRPVEMKHSRPEVLIRTSHLGKSSFKLDYAIISRGKDGEVTLHTLAHTVMVTLDPVKGTPIPLPDMLRKQLSGGNTETSSAK